MKTSKIITVLALAALAMPAIAQMSFTTERRENPNKRRGDSEGDPVRFTPPVLVHAKWQLADTTIHEGKQWQFLSTAPLAYNLALHQIHDVKKWKLLSTEETIAALYGKPLRRIPIDTLYDSTTIFRGYLATYEVRGDLIFQKDTLKKFGFDTPLKGMPRFYYDYSGWGFPAPLPESTLAISLYTPITLAAQTDTPKRHNHR